MRHAAESAQELLSCAFADPRNLQERAVNLALSAPLPMKRHGEAMGLVADLLDQVKDRRMALENDGLVLLPVNVNDFFLLRDAGERLIDNLQSFHRLGGGVQLPDAAVNKDQAWQRLLFFLHPSVAPLYSLAMPGELVP